MGSIVKYLTTLEDIKDFDYKNSRTEFVEDVFSYDNEKYGEGFFVYIVSDINNILYIGSSINIGPRLYDQYVRRFDRRKNMFINIIGISNYDLMITVEDYFQHKWLVLHEIQSRENKIEKLIEGFCLKEIRLDRHGKAVVIEIEPPAPIDWKAISEEFTD